MMGSGDWRRLPPRCVFWLSCLSSGTGTVHARGQLVIKCCLALVIQAHILCCIDITWRKPVMLVRGSMGKGQENIFKVFFQSILLQLPLKSLLSGLQQLNSHTYINSKETLKSSEMFQVSGCCWGSWNSCLFSLLLLDSLQF